MNQNQHPRRDFLQNITITLLTVSAVLLFAQTQLYNLGAGTDYFGRFASSISTDAPTSVQIPLSAPVRIAVTGPYGRFGNTTLSTNQSEFEPLGTLLNEVLGSAKVFEPCDPQLFTDVLASGSSVYYDFCASLPLPVLAGLMGTSFGDDSISARRLMIAVYNKGVSLFLLDHNAHCMRASTAVSVRSLEDTISHYELGSATFALDHAIPGSESVSPYSLFPGSGAPPVLPMLTYSPFPHNTDQILSALSFNPRTNMRYPEPDGTEVIVEGERTLSISPSGEIHYQSGGEAVLTVQSSNPESPSLREIVTGTSQLLNGLLDSSTPLYLSAVRQEESFTTLQFNYYASGIPILFADGIPAAEISLSGNTVSALKLRFRQYAEVGHPSLLLPLQQALAIAADNPGSELVISYVDRGTGTVSAVWLSE